jgi:membrane dipeptidase
LFNDSYTRWGPIQWMPPETLLRLGEHLAGRGWSDADIHAVLGGNFFRVAEQAWRA